jgi:hypothetical protein
MQGSADEWGVAVAYSQFLTYLGQRVACVADLTHTERLTASCCIPRHVYLPGGALLATQVDAVTLCGTPAHFLQHKCTHAGFE